MQYRIGQILRSTKEFEAEMALSGEKMIVPRGNEIIIGADSLAHHMETGIIQPLSDDAEVKGYDVDGLAEYLYAYLSRRFQIDEMLYEYDDSKEDFVSEISFALEDIGF